MNDQHDGRDRGPDSREQRREGGRGGSPGLEFLHLEVSRWLESNARAEGDGIVRELLRAAIRERLEERLGDRLRAVGAVIADEIADDLEANLAIEAAIDERRAAMRPAVEKAHRLIRERSPEKSGKKKR